MLKSVLYRPTGRINSVNGEEVEEKEPIFLSNRHTAGKSLYLGGRIENGIDFRKNSASAGPENATGYQILIDTMTYIKQEESKQQYYELGAFGLTPSSFIPVAVGEGAWASNILTRRTYHNAGDFESGLTRQGSHNARQANAVASMDSISQPTFIWDASVEYTLAEIEQALQASNWDIIAAKHQSRMKMWQQGIQILSFLGTKSGSMQGLFNNTATNINSSFITAYISSLSTASAFATFVQQLMSTYWTNTNSTVLPTHFVIPMLDFLGLQVPVPGSVSLVPMIVYLENAFKAICGPNFKILGNPYADKTNANTLRAFNFNTYALYRYDPQGMRMDIPVDFTVTQPNTYNNWSFEDVAYAQLTGLAFFKPLETLLFQF
jgi:hypothetical protein